MFSAIRTPPTARMMELCTCVWLRWKRSLLFSRPIHVIFSIWFFPLVSIIVVSSFRQKVFVQPRPYGLFSAIGHVAVHHFFSKKDYNGILSLAIGHKEANGGNVHIAFSFASHVWVRGSNVAVFVPQIIPIDAFLLPEFGTGTNLSQRTTALLHTLL